MLGRSIGHSPGIVSIPERVWGGLEHRIDLNQTISGQFQSLRGFGVGWSGAIVAAAVVIAPFQSLRGFGVGWSVKRSNHGVTKK